MLSRASIRYKSVPLMFSITSANDGINLSRQVMSPADTSEIGLLAKLNVDTSRVSLRIPIGTC